MVFFQLFCILEVVVLLIFDVILDLESSWIDMSLYVIGELVQKLVHLLRIYYICEVKYVSFKIFEYTL